MSLIFSSIAKHKIIIGLLLLFPLTVIYANEDENNHIKAERYRQAGHPATTPAMFNDLSLDKDVDIRKRVASNRKTPKNILKRLAHDSDQAVKISLATNLSAADEVFLILARDSMQAVRSVVARFEYVPVAALEILAIDKNVDIRLEVARNLNANKVILIQLTHDVDNSVRAIAEQALQRLNNDKSEQ
jgi:hypothetical protein